MFELLAVLSVFVFGVDRIRRRISMVETPEVEEITPAVLPEAARRYFETADARMHEAGFVPVVTYRITNLKGGNVARVYGSFTMPETVSVMSVSTAAAGTAHARTVLGITTRYEDGTILSTSNSEGSFRFPQPAGRERHRILGTDDPAVLLARHRGYATAHASRTPVRMDRGSILRAIPEDHRALTDHLQAIGWMRLNPRERRFQATSRMGLHAVMNHLNPFVGTFAWTRLVAGAVCGTGLSLAALRWSGAGVTMAIGRG